MGPRWMRDIAIGDGPALDRPLGCPLIDATPNRRGAHPPSPIHKTVRAVGSYIARAGCSIRMTRAPRRVSTAPADAFEDDNQLTTVHDKNIHQAHAKDVCTVPYARINMKKNDVA
jgi:hypothetical protein